MSDVGQATSDLVEELKPPYVIAALVCEAILHEGPPDGGVLSLIRIAEDIKLTSSYTVPIDMEVPQEDFPPIPVTINYLVMIRGVEDQDEHRVTVNVVRPDGTRGVEAQELLVYAGMGGGINIKSELIIGFHKDGRHWLEVAFERRVIARTPIDVTVSNVVTRTPPVHDTGEELQ